MSQSLDELWELLVETPFPGLGKEVGDFPLYDSLVAGCVNRALTSAELRESELPELDDESSATIASLRAKKALSNREQEFLEYSELLAEICQALRARCSFEDESL